MIRIEKVWVVFNDSTGMPLVPERDLNLEEVREYVKRHPFPETKAYTTKDLLFDADSDMMWTLPDDITEEQREYIRKMVEELLGIEQRRKMYCDANQKSLDEVFES